MKKCMVFPVILLLCMIVTFHVRSMEVVQDPYVPNDSVCYLFAMPIDILNYITGWLMWESEKECVERINIVKTVPEKFFHWFPFESRRCSAWESNIASGVKAFFCPDETKIALYEVVCGICCGPQLVIIDDEQEREENKVIYNGQLEAGSYRTMGLSSLGHMIAVIYKQSVDYDDIQLGYRDVLVVKKMATQEVRKFDFPDCFTPITLAFNKQGTHVVMHGDEVMCGRKESKHIVFALKNSDPEPHNAIAKPEHLLQDYCRHNRICKNIERFE